jgi:hypothetical protein
MKGIVFTLFNQFVEKNYNIIEWETLLENAKPASEGIYTAGDTYPDSEMIVLVSQFAQQTQQTAPKLLYEFGQFMFQYLANNYPVFTPPGMTLKPFLKTIDSVIHIEVRKLYPDGSLPLITYEEPSNNMLIMNYRSPRKLCHLAEGLIQGSASYFNEAILVKQTQCMHQGADHCRLEVEFL